MRCESAEITCHVTVYVPSPRPGGSAITTDSSTTRASPETTVGLVVEHRRRAPGEGHLLAEAQDDLGR